FSRGGRGFESLNSHSFNRKAFSAMGRLFCFDMAHFYILYSEELEDQG
ncbi:MAG: hypothetical protein ACI9FU_001971, partial [Granulosicoccus sp.]